MTDCTHLSDRMPDVALGRSRWTAAEERHLAVCADCRAEWTIVSAARRLGSALPAPGDPAVTAARVLGRIADERTRGRTRARVWMAAGLAAAAALAVIVGSRQTSGSGPAAGSTPDVPVAAAPAPSWPAPVGAAPAVRGPVASGPSSAASTELRQRELDGLSAEALDSILRVLDEPLAKVDPYDNPTDQAGDHELERALAGLEG